MTEIRMTETLSRRGASRFEFGIFFPLGFVSRFEIRISNFSAMGITSF